MTDEEMAEEYVKENTPLFNALGKEMTYTYKYMKQAYLAGLKAGRPKWHKVADGDLPKEEDLVLFKTDVDYYIGKIDYSKKCWWPGVCRDESICNSFVIAWCEIPKYTEE